MPTSWVTCVLQSAPQGAKEKTAKPITKNQEAWARPPGLQAHTLWMLEGRALETTSRGCRAQETEGAGEAAVTQESTCGHPSRASERGHSGGGHRDSTSLLYKGTLLSLPPLLWVQKVK